MADLKTLLDQAIRLADMADDYIPAAANVTGALKLGDGIIGVIDTLKEDASPVDQAVLQQRRSRLAAAVKAKAATTADRLRG